MKHFFTLLVSIFVLTSCGDARNNIPPPSNRPAIHVLFVGDVYTSAFDMPAMLEYISRTNTHKEFQIITSVAVKPEMNLDQLWNDPEIQKKFKERKWDFVVLQPSGTWAVQDKMQKGSYEGAKVWSLAAQKAGTKPVWFMTWIRKPGTEWYTKKNFVAITRSPEFMYQHIQKQSQNLVAGYKMLLVPVGDYWFYSNKKHPEIPLYAEDGNFPSQQGAYLNSLIFYRYLTGGEINENTFRPPEITHEQFLGLRNLASQTVR